LLYTLDALARSRGRLGDYEASLRGFLEAQALARKVVGEPSALVAGNYNDLGSLLQDMARYDEAEQAYLASIGQYQQVGDEGSAAHAVPINNLATLLEDTGRFDEAVQRYRQALAMRIAGGASERAIARGQGNLARALIETGAEDEARGLA